MKKISNLFIVLLTVLVAYLPINIKAQDIPVGASDGSFGHLDMILTDSIKGLNIKDAPTNIIGCYSVNGELYASHVTDFHLNDITQIAFVKYDNSDWPAITGITNDGEALYAVIINGKTYTMDVFDISDMGGGYDLKGAMITDDEVVVHNNMYFSIPIEWVKPSNFYLTKTPVINQKIYLKDIRPKYSMGVESYDVLTGTGSLYESAFQPYYQLSEDDIKNGLIKIRVNGTPGYDVINPITYMDYTWEFEPVIVENDYPYPDLNTRKWNVYLKYFLDVKLENGELIISQKPGKYQDRLVPALNVIVKGRFDPQKRGPAETIKIVELYDGHPNWSMDIPDNYNYINVRLTSPHADKCGKDWTWRK